MDDENEVFIALGGNIGGAPAVMARFRAVLAELRTCLGGPIRSSRVYRSAPVGPVTGQPRFLNAVLACTPRPALPPTEILAVLLDIEATHGRERDLLQGPRTIDLDLLFAGDQVLATPGPPPLILPHPRIGERAFVLQPLADLQGLDWCMPGLGRTVGACLAEPALAGQHAALELYAEAIDCAALPAT